MTSNPIYAVDRETGKRGWFCTKVSAGCQNCYAEKLNKRFGHGLAFTEANRERVEWRLNERELAAILHRRKPTRIFLGDMGDLFHEDVPEGFIDRVFATMALAEQHTFQMLTKRPERMQQYLVANETVARIDVNSAATLYHRPLTEMSTHGFVASVKDDPTYSPLWPLPNVHLGVTAENQQAADERIPILLETPAAKRFVSCEPLLGPLNLVGKGTTPGGAPVHYDYLGELCRCGGATAYPGCCGHHHACPQSRAHNFMPRQYLDLVIVGGESGGTPGRALVERCPGHGPGKADHRTYEPCGGTDWCPKPKALTWVRRIRDDCAAAGVPFHFKQWPIPPHKPGGPALLDGREWRGSAREN